MQDFFHQHYVIFLGRVCFRFSNFSITAMDDPYQSLDPHFSKYPKIATTIHPTMFFRKNFTRPMLFKQNLQQNSLMLFDQTPRANKTNAKEQQQKR